MAMVAAHTADWPRDGMAVIGSSLGGFYATWVAQQTGCKAVLLNPAVEPARDLSRHIGQQTSWHDPTESFYFRPEYVDELRVLDAQARSSEPMPERFFAIVAKGDEVLDWREMVGRYPGSHLKLLESGDHALSDFEDHLDEVIAFLQLA